MYCNNISLSKEVVEYLEKEAKEQNTTISVILCSIVYREIDRVNSLLDEV